LPAEYQQTKPAFIYLRLCFANYKTKDESLKSDAFIAAWKASKEAHKPASPRVNEARIKNV